MSSDLQILSKIQVGDIELKNRVILAPLTRARGTPAEDPMDPVSRTPNDVQALYYEQRASGGLVITEATGISEEGYGWRNAAAIYTDEHVEGWKKVTERVHAKDGKIFCQLWHMGRQAHSSFHPTTNRVVAPSAEKMAGTVKSSENEDVESEVPHALTVDEIKATITDYVNAAERAKAAGFDGVEIHSANGYLIDLFLQSKTNKRTDEYGGSKENRVRFLKEVTEAIITSGAFPASRIGFRLSPNGAFGDMGSEDNFETFVYVAKEMNTYNLAYMHVMDGLGFGFHAKDKIVTCADLRKVYDGIIMANVGLTKEVAEGMVRSGAVDLVCFGRLYISNPDLPERFANNWPLADPAPYETWWGHTAEKGYTDWPVYESKE